MFRRFLQLGTLCVSTSLLSAEHWAFQPLKPVKGTSIDEFIQKKLVEHGLKPSPRADAHTLARRASFDLTGLQPERTDVPYEHFVDQLLSSPHYGEQWARHWLDVARYSDTKGYVYAREEKNWVHATPYRDWVVRALNEDMPYDRFLLLQIAADQVVPPKSPDLAAMGFLTLGRRFLGVTHDIIDDRIDVVTRGTLGLTVACARCHDHKFDPIPTRDYYALYGVFQSSAEALAPCADGENAELTALVKKNRDLMTKRRNEQMARNRARMADYLAAQKHLDDYPEEVFSQILDEKDLNPFVVHRWKAWLEKNPGIEITNEWLRSPGSPAFVPDEHIANIEMYFPTGITTELWKSQGDVDRFLIKNNTTPAHATLLTDRAFPSTPRVFNRGNPLTKGDAVSRQFLSLFGPQQPFKQGSGRLELAQAIIDPRNPLTARVMVNRLWQHHFGRGLVSTPSDFGKQGSPPSHPELLDWLAQRFIDSGWSIKAMHRLIMLSETYRRTSFQARSKDELGSSSYTDPDNRLLARMTPHRLSFEEARDAWLASAGRLNLRVGGRPEGLFTASNTRRTLYTLVDRENVPMVMRTFDFANPDLSIPQRTETTVPQQALFGLNHPFVVQQAKALIKWSAQPERSGDSQPQAARRASEARQSSERRSDAEKTHFIYQRLFQRPPTPEELTSALAFVQTDTTPFIAAPDHSKSWHYGYGEWDEAAGRVKNFKPLPHFTGHAWQGAEDWPNAQLGWAQLTAEGGHPGNDRKHAVVRRWIAPTDGSYDLHSTLIHEPEVGDGIRAFVSHSRLGKLRSTTLLGSKADLQLDSIAFQAGDTLDFIVDIGNGLNSDQFLWSPKISPSVTATTGAGGDSPSDAWDAQKDFPAQPKSQLNAWEQFVQVLMLSNEFMFVD
ncbi:DUF1549 and DUF1553 domain-containing protein [Prosthecobacter sp.]|uniref:DUF1549 and DUF1553 domain-containing protein n=1 Tax=Prosthecobacter sp. TaxID=1965333 RepID=UPI002ABBA006|nr:DUF1549 and DUF1553 domain-containing protein [Prosthecobacter sp.]MDZ4406179.1 DUF1549 and DUF1553 domain-containing protein [Prosthecobacter sp.]